MSENVRCKKILSAKQRNAIELMVLGKSDTETAQAVGVDPRTLYRWRYQHPWFQAELNRQLTSRWKASLDRMQSLVPKAIDQLVAEIDQEKPGMAAVRRVLNFVGRVGKLLSFGPTSADAIIEQMVEHTRGRAEIDFRKTVSPLERAFLNKARGPQQIAQEEVEARDAVFEFLDRVLAEDEALTVTGDTTGGTVGDTTGDTVRQSTTVSARELAGYPRSESPEISRQGETDFLNRIAQQQSSRDSGLQENAGNGHRSSEEIAE
jgi:hypothetical protein